MPGPTFRHVTSGAPMKIPAGDYNAMIDAARQARQARLAPPAVSPIEHYQHARVLNDSGEPIGRHRVLTIEAPSLNPAEYTVGMDTFAANLDGFSARLEVRGVTPAANDQDLAITLEAAADGHYARCCVSGVCAALVEIEDEDHVCAGAQAGTMLISMSRGPAVIIWKQPEEERETIGVALCLIRLIGRRPAGDLFAVTCTIDGGSAGSASTTCSFTYTVTDLHGVVIGEDMSPEQRRYPNVPYTTTPNDTPGLAYYDAAGDLHLWSANELAQTEEC